MINTNLLLDVTLPVNVGNPDEHTIKEFATIIKDLTNSQSKVVNLPPTEDDPQRRRPDISRAKKEFDWEPKMGLTEGKNQNLPQFQFRSAQMPMIHGR